MLGAPLDNCFKKNFVKSKSSSKMNLMSILQFYPRKCDLTSEEDIRHGSLV